MREKIKRGASNFFKIIKKPEMEVLPGHLAFSFVLSIVPTLTILTYIASLFHFDLHFIIPPEACFFKSCSVSSSAADSSGNSLIFPG